MSPASSLPNIGPLGVSRRRTGGLIALASGIVLASLLIALDLPLWSRLLVLVPFWAAGLGLFQASEKT